jgi:hypothetical protein
MTNRSAMALRACLCATLAMISAGIAAMPAQDSPAVHADPYLPPAMRHPSREKPAAGAALQQQAMQKLKRRFDAADLDANGSLTRKEAASAGLGFIVKHFDQIDSAHRGQVSFAELQQFMASRRRQAMPK